MPEPIKPKVMTVQERFALELLKHHNSEIYARRTARTINRALRVVEMLQGHKHAAAMAQDETILATLCKRYLVQPNHQELVMKLVQSRWV